jgi:hypothetical protein
MAARKNGAKRSLADEASQALQSATQETHEAPSDQLPVADEPPQEPAPAPAPSRTQSPADVFLSACNALIQRLFIVTDPRLPKRDAAGSQIVNGDGEKIWMNQKEMHDAYKAVISQFRKAVANIDHHVPRTVCQRHLMEIETMTRQARFNPQHSSETELMRKKQQLKLGIRDVAQRCREELEGQRATA